MGLCVIIIVYSGSFIFIKITVKFCLKSYETNDLDDGISFVHTNTSITLLTPSVRDLSIGMVYGVERVGEKIYLATNQGAYEYNRRTSEIHLLPHTSVRIGM